MIPVFLNSADQSTQRHQAPKNMDISRRELQQLFLAAKSSTEIDRKIRECLENGDATGKMEVSTKEGYVECDFRIAISCLLNSYRATERSVEKFLNHWMYKSENFFENQR